MPEWRLTFAIRSIGLNQESDGRRVLNQVVSRLTHFDPRPFKARQAEFAKMGYGVKVAFLVDVEAQFDAVRRQTEIDEKRRTALKAFQTSVGFGNPTAVPK
jgi:hypothetical protein